MPLKPGNSPKTIRHNIAELIRSTRRRKHPLKPSQAVAIAYRKAGIKRRKKGK